MPSKIQKRFTALARELDLTTGAPAFELQPEVLATVELQRHLEEDVLSAFAGTTGVLAAGPLVTLGPFVAGAYLIYGNIHKLKAIAADAAFTLKRFIGPTYAGGLSQILGYGYYNAAGEHFHEFPQIIVRLRDGDYVTVVMENNQVAGDYVAGLVVVQAQ